MSGRTLTRQERRRLERRASQLEAELDRYERAIREGDDWPGMPESYAAVVREYETVELALLEDEYAQADDSFRAAIL